MRQITSLMLVAFLLTACASNPDRIDTAVTHCCATADYKTFDVTAKDIPAFLGPLMVSDFSVAFADAGMQPVQAHGDLHVILRFDAIDLDKHRASETFQGKIDPGATRRFIARIDIEMHDARTGNIVWAGHIQRLHDVAPGDYMHTGPASIAILNAFVKLLKHYPH